MNTDYMVAALMIDIVRRGAENFTKTDADLLTMADTTEATNARVKAATELGTTALIGIGAGAAIAAAASAMLAARFQADMELIHTEAGATQAEVVQMTGALEKLSATDATGPEQLAQSLYHVESAGLRGAEALNVVAAAAEGAKIGQADLEATTQAMIAATVSHIGGVHGEIDAMAQLNAIVGTGDMRMQDLAQAMATGILPAAANFGLELRDVGAALATVTDNATPAVEVATRLRMTIALMGAPTEGAAKALAQIGISSTQLATDMRQHNGLLTALEDLKQHLHDSGKSAEEQSAIITRAFGGGRSSATIETLLQQLDRMKSKYQEQSVLVAQFGEDWKRTQQTTSFALQQLDADAKNLGIAIGSAVLPPIDALARDISPIIAGVAQWSHANQELTKTGIELAVGLGGIALAYKAIMFVAEPWAALQTKIAGQGAADAGAAKLAADGIDSEGAAAAATVPEIQALISSNQELVASMGEVGASGKGGLFAGLVDKLRGIGGAGQEATVGLAAERAALAGVSAEAPAAAAAVAETGVAATGAETALGAGGMAGAVGLLMQPEIGIPALIIAGGVLAYTTMPAVREATNSAAEAIGTKIQNGVTQAGSALGSLGHDIDLLNYQLEHLGSKAKPPPDAPSAWDQFAKSIGDTTVAVATSTVKWAEHDRGLQASARYMGELGTAMDGTRKLTDQQTAAYDRLGDAMRRVGSGGASLPTEIPLKVQEASDAGTFSTDLKKAQSDLAEAQAAEAGAIRFGLPNIQALGQKAAEASVAVQRDTQAQIEAGLRSNLISGQATSAVQSFVNEIKGRATDSLSLLAVGIQRGAANLPELTKNAIDAARGAKAYDIAQAEATKIVAEAVPPFKDAAKAAAAMAKAGVDFATQITKAASDSAAALAEAIDRHAPGPVLDRLTNAAVKAEVAHLHLSAAGEAAAMKIAKGANDWAGYQSILQKQLSDTLNAATGKYLADQRSGNTGALPGDRQEIDHARERLQHLNTELANLTGKSVKLSNDFTTLSQAASDRASKSLDALALGIEQHRPDAALDKLEAKALAAANGSEKFTSALAEANARVASSSSNVVVRIDALASSLDTKLKTATDQAVDDILLHGHVTAQDRQELLRHAAASKELTDAEAKVAALLKPVIQSFSDLESSLKDHASKALDTLELALDKHTGEIGLLTDRAAQWGRVEATTAQVVIDANLRVARSMGDLGTEITNLEQRIANQRNFAANLVATGQQNAPGEETPRQMAEDRLALAKTGQANPRETEYGQDLDALVKSTKELIKEQNAQIQVDTTVDERTGQFGAALSLISSKLNTEVSNALGQATLGIGNWQGALDKAAKDQESEQQKTAAATAAWVQSEINAARQAGDSATAFSLGVTQANDQYTKDLNSLAGKIHDHQVVTQADTDSVRADRAAQDANTQATWDATFATSSLAEQQNMLSQRFASMVSQANTTASANQAVDSAKLQVIAADSQIEVDRLTSLVSLTTDQTGVITAQTGEIAAAGAASVAAIKAETSIIQAQAAVTMATSPAELKIAQDQLKVAFDEMRLQQIQAAWDERIAADQVVLARDKMQVDSANAAAQAAVDQDHLAVAQDAVKLAVDQLKLSMDMLQVDVSIASALGVVGDFQGMIEGDLASINADQQQNANDASRLATDQANQSRIAQQGLLLLAQDAQRIALDQQAKQAAVNAAEIQLALDQQQLVKDQTDKQIHDAQITQAADLKIAQLEGQIVQLQGQRDLLQYDTSLSASQLSLEQSQYDAQIAGVKAQEAAVKLAEDQALGASSAQLQQDQNAITAASYDVLKAQLAETQASKTQAGSLLNILIYEMKAMKDALAMVRRGSAAGPHWVGSASSGNFDVFLNSTGAEAGANPGSGVL